MAGKTQGRKAGEEKCVIFFNDDSVMRAFRDGERHIDLSDYYKKPLQNHPKPLAHILLRGLLRDYIINKVKAPLMKAIILAAKLPGSRLCAPLVKAVLLASKRLPLPRRENCYANNALVLMTVWERFFTHFYGGDRLPMMKAARDISIAEIEHDIVYDWFLNWFIKEIIKEVEAGNWQLNNKPFPIPGNWVEDGEEKI